MSINVKALEWIEDGNHSKANTAFGRYLIWPGTGFEYLFDGPGGCRGKEKRIDEAKAAAQADYERRILSAIEPSLDKREAVEALERANALTSAGNRTFDELTRDVTRANGEIRMALNVFRALTGAKP